jgi:septum site-determining protein MinC
MTTEQPASKRKTLRFRGRSYIAVVFTPEAPIFNWLADLDEWIRRSAGYFNDKPVVVDLSAVALSNSAIVYLLGELEARKIRVIGLEGVDPSELAPNLPPVLKSGRAGQSAETPEAAPPRAAARPSPPEAASLLLECPVRAGQTVVFPQGDVTVLGSVASGAEIVAGGSIHIYGTLRGRAFAGSTGNSRARIFCNKVEAELLAIDGLYRTADDIESSLRSQPIQAWLKDDVMFIAPLN